MASVASLAVAGVVQPELKQLLEDLRVPITVEQLQEHALTTIALFKRLCDSRSDEALMSLFPSLKLGHVMALKGALAQSGLAAAFKGDPEMRAALALLKTDMKAIVWLSTATLQRLHSLTPSQLGQALDISGEEAVLIREAIADKMHQDESALLASTTWNQVGKLLAARETTHVE